MRAVRFGLIVFAVSSLLVGNITTAQMIQDTRITKIDGDFLTVETGKKFRTYRFTRLTEVVINGQEAQTTDLRVGMFVHVTMGTDAREAARVVAEGTP